MPMMQQSCCKKEHKSSVLGQNNALKLLEAVHNKK